MILASLANCDSIFPWQRAAPKKQKRRQFVAASRKSSDAYTIYFSDGSAGKATLKLLPVSSEEESSIAAGERNRLAEKGRTQISDWRAAVRAIEKISNLHGQFQLVRAFVIVVPAALLSASCAKRTVCAGSVVAVAALRFFRSFLFSAAETEFSGGAQVDDEKFGSSPVVSGMENGRKR